MLARLRADWTRLLAPFGAGAEPVAKAWNELEAAYARPDRRYHTLRHIARVLEVIDRLCDRAQDPVSLRLAAWYHDAVYDSRAKDNEERSADLARAVLPTLGVPANVTDGVAALILLTKTHEAPAEDRDALILLDADLAILGAGEQDYAAYSRAIRQEYAWVREEEYRAGRRHVLQRFLRRARIFQTEPMYAAHEAQARQNLQREIASLC
jgi:predicted metal-dependent HD superfamily phosphohydrolase